MARISKEVVPVNDTVKEIRERVLKISSHISKFKNQGNGLGKANARRQIKAVRKEIRVLENGLNDLEDDLSSDDFGS